MKAVIEGLKALSTKCLSRMKRAFGEGRVHAAALYIHLAAAVVATSRRGKDAIIRLHYRARLYIALVVLLLVAYFRTDITVDDSAFFENIFAAIFGATLTFALIDFVTERGKTHEMKPVRAGLMREVQGLSASLQNIIGQLVRRTEAVPSVNVLNECGDPDYEHAFYIARLSENERKLGEDPLVLHLRNLKSQCDKLIQRYLTHMPPSLVKTLLQLENLPGRGYLDHLEKRLLSHKVYPNPWEYWMVFGGKAMKQMREIFANTFVELDVLEKEHLTERNYAFRSVCVRTGLSPLLIKSVH